MIHIEEALEKVINSVFENGEGLGEPLRLAVIEANIKKNIFFSLQLKYGIIFSTNFDRSILNSNAWEQNALQSLAPDAQGTKRFIFSMAQAMWDVLSCFKINDSLFYGTIAIINPQQVQPSLCVGIIKLLDLLCNRCKAVLSDFFKQLNAFPGEPDQTTIPHCQETMIFKRIMEFSGKVQCIALIDNDGFILHTQGSIEVEKIASHLALFHKRCVRELAEEGYANVRSEMFSCDDSTILIGHIQQSNLALAIVVKGRNFKPIASLLFDAAHGALGSISQKTNLLWGAPVNAQIQPVRIRDSWFSPTRLAPKGNFVGIISGKSFHYASCKVLSKSEDNLEWFDKRGDAIRAGLSPCKSCNP
jgi:hypothetical protein